MRSEVRRQEWVHRRELGALPLIKAYVWVALRVGRPLMRLFLYPICLYFMLFAADARKASRAYLARVFGRPARTREVFQHFLTFAACLLDRAFLLNDQKQWFAITVHNEDLLQDIEATGGGCMLFGAHFGSFEVARTVGRQRADLPISLLMYEENAQKIREVLGAINPRLAAEVIGLGRLDSLITVADRLQRGHFIGVLADRNVDGRDLAHCPFLGAKAAFPKGPFRVAMLLQRPIVLMASVYRGGGDYEVYFEQLAPALTQRPPDMEAWIDEVMRRYVQRLEFYCRDAPFNWFNFYDFWL
ncbi:acyl-CoA synthetase [Acidithiobacillus sp. AMEEHan]|uniref:LpxL/LpxP family acyltransferase n=1 Tax=Acidithiobacillus sp. AMEEHan TaxID=2994951 RepID=UPI0027E4656D|nr:acyl-CoA synthetase [Acidithiobacillus sp. AMEEHan]